MEKEYIALQTKSFTEGQAVADIIKGHKYTADKENEWFIGEFADRIYIPQEEFDNYFSTIKIKSYQARAKKKYSTSGKNVPLYMTLFPSKDQDIIDRLNEVATTLEMKKETKGGRNGKAEYIRRLIREDIKRQKGE